MIASDSVNALEVNLFNPSKDLIFITEISSESGVHSGACKSALFSIGRFNRTISLAYYTNL
jgi:hypothetical protein